MSTPFGVNKERPDQILCLPANLRGGGGGGGEGRGPSLQAYIAHMTHVSESFGFWPHCCCCCSGALHNRQEIYRRADNRQTDLQCHTQRWPPNSPCSPRLAYQPWQTWQLRGGWRQSPEVNLLQQLCTAGQLLCHRQEDTEFFT